MASDAAIPVIQVTEEPISEPVSSKKDAVEAENDVLQMIIDQQKSKRKKFVFRDKQDGQQMTFRFMLTIFSAGFGSPFLVGYNVGVVNIPQRVLVEWIRSVQCVRNPNDTTNTDISWCHQLNDTQQHEEREDNYKLRMMWITVNFMFCIGGVLGALASQYLVKRYGRKRILIANNLLSISGGILFGVAYVASSYTSFIIGRILVGINGGVSTAVAPLYFMGLVPPALGGAYGALQRLFDVTGTLVAFVLGLPFILGGSTTWPYLFGFVILPAFVQLITLPFCPEDPRYLSEVNDNEAEAEKVLRTLRTVSSHIEDEILQMRQMEVKAHAEPNMTFLDMLHDSKLRVVVVIGLILISSRQLTGINAAYFFSTIIFESAGLRGSAPFYGTIGVGVTLWIATLVTALLVEKAGRRPLLLVGLSGSALTAALLTTFVVIGEDHRATGGSTDFWAPYASMATLFVFVIVYSIGPGTIPSFMIAEMFHEKDKTVANSVDLMLHWLCGALVVILFPFIQAEIHGYVFVLFAGLSMMYIIIVAFKIPETKHQDAADVQNEIVRRVKMCSCT